MKGYLNIPKLCIDLFLNHAQSISAACFDNLNFSVLFWFYYSAWELIRNAKMFERMFAIFICVVVNYLSLSIIK